MGMNKFGLNKRGFMRQTIQDKAEQYVKQRVLRDAAVLLIKFCCEEGQHKVLTYTFERYGTTAVDADRLPIIYKNWHNKCVKWQKQVIRSVNDDLEHFDCWNTLTQSLMMNDGIPDSCKEVELVKEGLGIKVENDLCLPNVADLLEES